jgi:N-acetyl-anhydromuramyl-L-alanine amidase AmpD
MDLSWGKRVVAIDSNERRKSYPNRYPVNSDSIGIEIVGKHINKSYFETVTYNQNESLKTLLKILHQIFNTDESDIYTHPEVSYKHPGEASTAAW